MKRNPVAGAVGAALANKGNPMTQQRQPQTSLEIVDALLEQARQHLANANVDRLNLIATMYVLLQKLGGDAVITKGELEAIPDGIQIQKVDETDLGFKLVAVTRKNAKRPV